MRSISLIKLGGSLITDKSQVRSARVEVIERLAGEVAKLREEPSRAWIVGHGSGSFGHVEAKRYSVHEGVSSADQLTGVSATADAAAELHRLVVRALVDAGAVPFSFAPSSALVSAAGRTVSLGLEPLTRAMELGLLPVLYGDVVLDREQGCAICSTEAVFLAVVEALGRQGRSIEAAYWLGDTDGVYDENGETISRIEAERSEEVLARVEGSKQTDVTGGMRHRLATAVALARLGVRSWIGSGLEPGRLGEVAAGGDVPGTWVE